MKEPGKDIKTQRQPVRAADIKRLAEEAGFSLCGVASNRTLPEHLDRLEQWLAAGSHGQMSYMERNRAKRADPCSLLPGTRTVIVCAVNYRNGAWDVPADGRPKIASYAFARDYHDSIKGMLLDMLGRLREIYPSLEGRPLTDSAPIFEKAWAVEAGLGWIGRNSLLVTPRYGSTVLLGELLINLPADNYDKPYTGNGCGNCSRCIDSCPNRAISGNKTIDTTRCISRLTIERNPPASDVTLDGWVFGCDACQMCCPHNSRKPRFDSPLFAPVADPEVMDKDFWCGISYESFSRLFTGTALERPGFNEIYEKIKRLVVE